MSKILKLILCIALPLTLGGLSGFFTVDGLNDWYETLEKPFFNPPNYLFGPVWTTLYILMGGSLFMVINTKTTVSKNSAIGFFAVQLTLNFWWSIIFFTVQSPGWALVEMLFLLISILAMIVSFKRINTTAAYLQIPYLLWVNFAAILNASIWLLNR